jgi:hypothetical protein
MSRASSCYRCQWRAALTLWDILICWGEGAMSPEVQSLRMVSNLADGGSELFFISWLVRMHESREHATSQKMRLPKNETNGSYCKTRFYPQKQNHTSQLWKWPLSYHMELAGIPPLMLWRCWTEVRQTVGFWLSTRKRWFRNVQWGRCKSMLDRCIE